MRIFGLPVHVLVVHAAVVFVPLAVLVTIAFAALPQWRYLSRWPTAVLALVATASVWGARLSGTSFKNDLIKQGRVSQALISTHESRGKVLALIMIAFLVIVLVGVRRLGGPSGLTSGKGAVERGPSWAESVLPLALVGISVVALVWVVLTGDAGSRAVWG